MRYKIKLQLIPLYFLFHFAGFNVVPGLNAQPSNPPFSRVADLNGKVNVLFMDVALSDVYISGDFVTVNNIPCLHVAKYHLGQLSCFGNGIDGIVNAFGSHDTIVEAGGAFPKGDSIYPYAYFDGSKWTFLRLPGYKKAVCTAFFNGEDGFDQMAITYPDSPGVTDVWLRDYEVNTWQKKLTVNGVILSIEATRYGRVYAGAYKNASLWNNGVISKTISTNNAVISPSPIELYPVGSGVPDTITAVRDIGGALYYAGRCGPGTSGICLSRYYSGTAQILLRPTNTNEIKSINSFELFNQSKLIVGGDFTIIDWDLKWQNLATYDIVQNVFEGLGNFTNTIAGIGRSQNDWLIGGSFTKNMSTAAPYLVKIGYGTDIDFNELQNGSINIFPNPASSKININISMGFELKSVKILDLLGRPVYSENIRAGTNFSVDISSLQTGLYYMMLCPATGDILRKPFEVR